jgi:dTDP-4-amino-4,6-dideoxygalactose transaminase
MNGGGHPLSEIKHREKPAAEGGNPVRNTFLIYGSPRIEEPEILEILDTLKSGWLGTGKKTHAFEELFKKHTGSRHALALNSCTAALHLACVVSGLKPGDEVITTPMTFCATANVIVHTGATPVFADVEKDSMNIDPEQIEAHITDRTRAILIVHFAGRSCRMDEIVRIAKKHNLILIEDCAHAIETCWDGKPAGTFGTFGCFSFYVTKNVVTGEGGMLVTDNGELDEHARILSLHGMSKDAYKRFSESGYKHYGVEYAGFKYNMTDMQASLGIHQLGRLASNWERRKEIWNRYNEAFRDLPCITPAPVEEGTKHAFHLYTLLLRPERLRVDRDTVLDALAKENIGVGVHYLALHLQPFYRQTYHYHEGMFPNTEWISERTLSIPLSPKLSDDDAGDVIRAVRKVLTWYEKEAG